MGGAAGVPPLRYNKLLLSCCNSGDYFYNQFRHGTLFYSVAPTGHKDTMTAYFTSIIAGETDLQITESLNTAEEPETYDYWLFPK